MRLHRQLRRRDVPCDVRPCASSFCRRDRQISIRPAADPTGSPAIRRSIANCLRANAACPTPPAPASRRRISACGCRGRCAVATAKPTSTSAKPVTPRRQSTPTAPARSRPRPKARRPRNRLPKRRSRRRGRRRPSRARKIEGRTGGGRQEPKATVGVRHAGGLARKITALSGRKSAGREISKRVLFSNHLL